MTSTAAAESVQKDRIVRIDVELRIAEPGGKGDVIESSKRSGPVEYRHGSGQLLVALEKKLEGMKVGDEKSGTIPAKEAFGAAPTIEQKLSRKAFPKETDSFRLDVGTRFEAKMNGSAVLLEVASADGDDIVAKVIHPLADKDLDFTVKILGIRPPPPPVPPPPASLDGDDLLEADE